MELRSFNVERLWSEVVTIRIGDEIGIRHDLLQQHTTDIKDMITQLAYKEGLEKRFNMRKDGEVWTPYLQIVEMLLLMGKKLGYVSITGKCSPNAIIRILI